MAGNGDPAEISQVLCLKRIIIVVGWDRYDSTVVTCLRLLDMPEPFIVCGVLFSLI